MTHEKETPDRLPESLIAELKKVDEAGPTITAKVDRAVLQMAREQFATRPERRRRAAPMWLAAAATLVLVVFLLQTQDSPKTGFPDYYADVDGSGQVDIADVLALARRGDRAPTQAELDAFAMRIVSLADDGDAL